MNFLACLVLLLGVVAGSDDTVCHDSVITACRAVADSRDIKCNASMGGFEAAQADLQAFANFLLGSSLDYQLLAAGFNSFENNQPGFKKVFLELADHAWNKGIEVIKHITKRGGKADLGQLNNVKKMGRVLELDAIPALSLALDTEKKLLTKAHHIHRRVSRHDSHNHYDPSIAHFIEERFLNHQPEVIRKVSGYVNDMVQLARNAEPSLAFYLFDEHLAGLSSVI